jgi:hypothetical protein
VSKPEMLGVIYTDAEKVKQPNDVQPEKKRNADA